MHTNINIFVCVLILRQNFIYSIVSKFIILKKTQCFSISSPRSLLWWNLRYNRMFFSSPFSYPNIRKSKDSNGHVGGQQRLRENKTKKNLFSLHLSIHMPYECSARARTHTCTVLSRFPGVSNPGCVIPMCLRHIEILLFFTSYISKNIAQNIEQRW